MELNPIASKRIKKLMVYLKKEYKKNSDFSISMEIKSLTSCSIILSYNRFLDCSNHDEYNIMLNELLSILKDRSEALSITEGNSIFSGDIASQLIKPGKILRCDSLMSNIEFILTYPATSK